jgi:hypothetical protein
MRILLFWFLSMTHLYSAYAVDRSACIGLVNDNAKVPSSEYSQLPTRDYQDLKTIFGTEFVRFTETLPTDCLIYDAGGGFSIYGISQARAECRVITSNAQDFYEDLLRPLTSLEKLVTLIEEEGVERHFNFGPVLQRHEVFNRLSHALDLPPPSTVKRRAVGSRHHGYWYLEPGVTAENAAIDLAKWISGVLQHLGGVLTKERFVRQIGMSQDILATLPDESISLYEDVAGSFYYSSDRLAQLEAAYRKLKPGGRIYIYVENLRDSVDVGGLDVPLFGFLVDSFPGVVRAYPAIENGVQLGHRGTVLRIEKPLGGPSTLNIPAEIVEVFPADRIRGYLVPKVRYRMITQPIGK